MNLRPFVLAAAAALAFGVVASPVLSSAGLAAEAPKTAHPHFNDGGTLSWSKKLADAQAAAKAQGKLIFIEYGREA